MEIVDNKALLLRLRHPQKVTTVIPKSKELEDNKVLVHWGLDEVQVLRNLNIKAPSQSKSVMSGRANTNHLNIRKIPPRFLPLTKSRSALMSRVQVRQPVRSGRQTS